MVHQRSSGAPGARDSRADSRPAPEAEGPEEIYRRFERLNRRGAVTKLRDLVSGSGKKALYGVLAVAEVAAIVLGLVFDVPFMDVVALGLPGLFVMFHRGSGGGEADGAEDDPGEKGILDRLLELLGDEGSPASGDTRSTGTTGTAEIREPQDTGDG